jgi:hypothetical protein
VSQQDLSETIQVALDGEPEYAIKIAVLSAHVQRIICDKAQNDPASARRLAEEFHALCLNKIASVTELHRADEIFKEYQALQRRMTV